MRLWIDNTGLQSAGKCLEGRARVTHEYDVAGLLQLATLLIYGNTISLNGFEEKTVAEHSRAVVEHLQALGVPHKTVSITPVSETEYSLACKTAGDLVAPELHESFNPDEYQLLGGEPPDLPRGIAERQTTFVTLAAESEDSERLRKARERALKDQAAGAVEYMVSVSRRLRDEIRTMTSRHSHWEDTHSYQLNIFLRAHLNHALAEQVFARYTPAVARAELINTRNQYILDALGEELDDVTRELRAEQLGVPSTVAALLQRSKGEPAAVIKVALEFRQHSSQLRESLEELSAKYVDDTPESRFEIRKKVKELGRQLRRDVGLEKRAELRDAVEVHFVVGVPVLSISGRELIRWLQQRRQRRRTAVLTELIKASSYSDMSTEMYTKLRKLSSNKMT